MSIFSGGCRCDAVRFDIKSTPMLSSICHCHGCQRMTGSAYSAAITVSGDGFSVTRGDPVVGGLRGDGAQHMHCDRCKSWVFTKFPEPTPLVNIRLPMLDDPARFPPFVEMQTAEALSWAVIGAERQFERFPEMAEFADLMSDYAVWQNTD
ncbi:MAG: GFA family protein [Pacificimonas sp.]